MSFWLAGKVATSEYVRPPAWPIQIRVWSGLAASEALQNECICPGIPSTIPSIHVLSDWPSMRVGVWVSDV